MRTIVIGGLSGLLIVALTVGADGQVISGENSAGVLIWNSNQSFSSIWIAGAPICAAVDSVEVHFSGTYPDEDHVTVRMYNPDLTKEFIVWHLESGTFQDTTTTSIWNGYPVNGEWVLVTQDLVPPPHGEPLGQVDEWWLRIYYKCLPWIEGAWYDGFVEIRNFDGDSYSEEYSFNVVVDAVTNGPPIDVKAKLRETNTNRVFWTNVWTVANAISNEHSMHFTDADFYSTLPGETWLEWEVELWNPAGTEQYEIFPWDLAYGPALVEPYIPSLDYCYISGFSGQDLDGDMFYETFSIDVRIDADVKAGTQSVSAIVRCETTGQDFPTFPWGVTGTNNYAPPFILTDQHFDGFLSEPTDLYFSVWLYDGAGFQIYDTTFNVANQPVKADAGVVNSVTVSGKMQYLDVFGSTHPIRFARVTVHDSDPPGAEYETATDDTGGYALTIPNDPDNDGMGADISAKVWAVGVPFASSLLIQGHEIVSVRDTLSIATYSLYSDTTMNNAAPSVLKNYTAPNSLFFDGVFSVYEAAIEGYLQAYQHFGFGMKPVVILWPHSVTSYTPLGPSYKDTMKVTRGNRWDWDVVIHEYGHGVAQNNYIGVTDIGTLAGC